MCHVLNARSSLLYAVLVSGLCLSGCGKEMTVAPVTGTVTLDGAPLERASVTFHPKDGGRPSFGVTNADGYYVLEYSLEEAGAEVGTCEVKITTAAEADDEGAVAAKERVPKRYRDTPIEVQVESKSNTIDIALTSDGAN